MQSMNSQAYTLLFRTGLKEPTRTPILCIYNECMKLFLSPSTRAKLARPDHNVTEREILECFANRDHTFLIDKRPEHQTPIPTQWFVSETDWGRKLKVVFIYDQASGIVDIKSAYPASTEIQAIYLKFSQPK